MAASPSPFFLCMFVSSLSIRPLLVRGFLGEAIFGLAHFLFFLFYTGRVSPFFSAIPSDDNVLVRYESNILAITHKFNGKHQ